MKYLSLTSIFFALPFVSSAAVNDVFNVEALILGLVEKFGYLLWLVAILFFFWGLVKFIKNASDTKEHEEGKKFLIWALISFLVLFSIWALVKFVFDSVGIVNPDKVCYIDKSGTSIDGAGAPCP